MSHAKRKSSTQHAHPVDAINSLIGVTAKGAAETLKIATSKNRKKAGIEQKTSVDLIFNLIDQCKAAMEDQDRAAMAEIPGRGAAAEASQRRLGRSFDTWRQTFELLISTTPTSPQALRAFAEFIINVSEEWGGDDGEVVSYKEWISIMRAISRYGLDHAAEPLASPELIDRAIFERVAALKKAWASCGKGSGLSDGALDEFLEHNFERPEKELRGMRPKTIHGALAKIEFFKWDAKAADSDDPLRRGVDAVISDLKALVSRSSNRAKAGVKAIFSKIEAHDAAGALRSVAENVPSIGQLDMSDLCALFDVLCHTHDSLMAFRDSPRFEEGMGLTPGGELLSGIVDTIGFLTQEIAEQLRRKSPDEDDFGNYVEVILRWDMRCGDDLNSLSSEMIKLKGLSPKMRGRPHVALAEKKLRPAT